MSQLRVITDRAEAPPQWTAENLERLDAEVRRWPLERVLAFALDTFAPGIALATSFGPQSIVLMHRIARLRPETTVFYLDTELLFPETYALRDELAARLGLTFTRLTAELSVDEQARYFGPQLWASQPDQCCLLRKVLPLRRFLASKRAWITGVRRAQSASRAESRVIEWDRGNGLVKLNPLAHWSAERTWRYLREHGLPYNPLHDEGYPSIGCTPCTRPVAPGADPRSGRWHGFEKTECGIHLGR
jgi:phosphoadenosine phosphosulfate reductase